MAPFSFCPLCGAKLERKPTDPDAGRPSCPTGHFIHYDNPALTTMAFIERDGSYLVLRRADEPQKGECDMPGGFVEAGEDPAESIQREILEETGLEVELQGVIGAYKSVYGDTGRHTVDIAFRATVTGGDVTLSNEKTEAMWVQLTHFPKLAFEGERRALEDLKSDVLRLTSDV